MLDTKAQKGRNRGLTDECSRTLDEGVPRVVVVDGGDGDRPAKGMLGGEWRVRMASPRLVS